MVGVCPHANYFMELSQPRQNKLFIFVEINSIHFNGVFELQVLQTQRAMSFGFRSLLQMLDFFNLCKTMLM
jgi:hypothetical protein